jgi:hypothetical protein
MSSLLLCAAAAGLTSSGTLLALSQHDAPGKAQRTLTFEERVSYQRAIEEVYWRHRIWPKENSNPKPSLDAVMTQAQLEEKVEDYLRKSQVLEDYSHRPISADQLQAEMGRMAKHTKQPEVLQELFEALGNDAFVIAECLARPALAERLSKPSVANQVEKTKRGYREILPANGSYTLPTISDTAGGCMDNTWSATSLTGAPSVRNQHTAVWTGTEMIVWGGFNFFATQVPDTIPAQTAGLPLAIATRPRDECLTPQSGQAVRWSSGVGPTVLPWSTPAEGIIPRRTAGQLRPPPTHPLPANGIQQYGVGVK